MGCRQALQSPLAVVGRRRISVGGVLRLGKGERLPPFIAGSMGDSGESIEGASGLDGRVANCSRGGGGSLFEVSSVIVDSRSLMTLSKFEISEGLRRDAERADGGLD